MKKALIVGSTGLIGIHLLHYLCNDHRYDRISLMLRTKMTLPDFLHKKVEQHIVDFNNLENYSGLLNSDDIFVCVGTTINKVKGDKAAFRKVDFDIPVNIARLAFQNNVKGFFVISSLGADAASGNFYLKTKGEMEHAVKQYKFERLSFLRPSLLLGPRNEKRPGENIAKLFMKPLSFLFAGPLRKYKPIDADLVAKTMIEIANSQHPKLIYEGIDIFSIPSA